MDGNQNDDMYDGDFAWIGSKNDDDMMVTLRGWEAKTGGEGLLWGLRVVM